MKRVLLSPSCPMGLVGSRSPGNPPALEFCDSSKDVHLKLACRRRSVDKRVHHKSHRSTELH